jgi:HSP20 family protein
MSNLIRWDPFREMDELTRLVDTMWDRPWLNRSRATSIDAWSLALDVVENEDNFVVKASVPGIKPEDLEITFTDNTLTIKGEMREDSEREEERYHLRERRFGRFSRSITMPTRIDADKIEAGYDSGVLTLRLPKVEEVKSKRITIKAGEPSKVIEGNFKKLAGKN